MFGTIRRHQQWLWFVIIAVMIVSLLYWTDQRPNKGFTGSDGKAPKVGGRTITPQIVGEFEREVRLLYFLNFRKWPEQDYERAQQIGFDLNNEALLRLFRVAKAEEAGVHVSDELLRDLTVRLLGDPAAGGMPVDKFAREVLSQSNPPLTIDDFERFVTHDAAIQQLGSVVGAAGRLVTPAEAEEVYRRERQELAGDIVFFSISNYLSKVVITNGALTNFFAQQAPRYRIPDKVRVSYAEIHKSNFMAQAEQDLNSVSNLSLRLLEVYQKMGGTNEFKDTNGVPLPEDKAIAKIKESETERRAFGLAARRANEVANKLFDRQPLTLDVFEKVAAEEKLPIQVSEPFDLENGPTNLVVAENFAKEAFQLDPTNKPVSFQPLGGSNGVYLIALKEKIPGRAQTFDEVKDKVTEDYRRFNAFTLARNDATNFVGRVTNAMPQGKTFAEVAQQLGLNAETLPPISQASEALTNLQERLNVNQLKNVMFSTEPGHVSSYIMNAPNGGYVVYVRAKLPIDEKKMRDDLPKFVSEMRYHKQNEIFNQWFRKQVEKEQWLRDLLEKNRKNRPPTQPG